MFLGGVIFCFLEKWEKRRREMKKQFSAFENQLLYTISDFSGAYFISESGAVNHIKCALDIKILEKRNNHITYPALSPPFGFSIFSKSLVTAASKSRDWTRSLLPRREKNY